MSDAIKHEISSGNVFENVGVPEAKMHQVKAQLVSKIMDVMTEYKLTQAATASILGITQPDVSGLLGGQFRNIPIYELMHHLVALGQDVDIIVKLHHNTQQPAQLTVTR